MIHHKNFPFHEPDDETEIIHINHPGSGGLRLGKVIFFILIAVAVFFGAKALYNLGKGQIYQAGTPVIEPNPEPYKTKPEDPGGMEIPHSDKEIYDHLRTPMDDAVDGPIDAYSAENSRPPTIAELADKNQREYAKIDIPETVVKPELPPVNTSKNIKVSKNGRVIDVPQSSSVTTIAPNAQKAKRIDVEKVLAKRTENEYWLQLGTFKSESEATKAWQQAREKNSDILKDLTVKVTKSDMREQGVLYRLQAGSAEDEEAAKSYCRKLTSRKQSCFYTIIKTQNNEL